MPPEIILRPYGEDDFPVLEATLGDPVVMEHIGGAESFETLRQRHAERASGEAMPFGDHIFVILADGTPAGEIGYWETEHDGQEVWESGWNVMTRFQGQGVATRAVLALFDIARADGRRSLIYAYPRTDNGASNAVCRKAGFTLEGVGDYEYPLGVPIKCNIWRYDLA